MELCRNAWVAVKTPRDIFTCKKKNQIKLLISEFSCDPMAIPGILQRHELAVETTWCDRDLSIIISNIHAGEMCHHFTFMYMIYFCKTCTLQYYIRCFKKNCLLLQSKLITHGSWETSIPHENVPNLL